MKHVNMVLGMALSAVLAMTTTANAGNPAGGRNQAGLAKTAWNNIYHPMLINNVFNYYANNGSGSFNEFSPSNEGFEVPKGKDLATGVFQDGVIWGCKKGGALNIGGSTYRFGIQAGPILVNGTGSTLPVADDASNPANRLYRVRPDMRPLPGVTSPSDPLAAAEKALISSGEVPFIGRYEGTTAEDILQQYWNDWLTWPAAQGAPYTDVNHNGTYEPTVDIPGVPGADQTIWYVANDVNYTLTANLAGSTPIGLEMQKTIWAYNLGGALGNTIFAATKLINKSGVQLDSMYIAQWSDPDVGFSGDDFIGCDTLTNLGFAYNGVAADVNYSTYGLVPPAVGFDLLQGPLVKGALTDTAIFGLAYRPGFKNLPMSAFVFFTQGFPEFTDPILGAGGDVQWYRLLQGRIASTGGPFINPVTQTATKFTLSGDPVAGTGWTDGMFGLSPQDRRMVMVTGPVGMAPGDTQEVVVACLSSRGLDRLSSVTALEADDVLIKNAYNSLFRRFPPKVTCSVAAAAGQATLTFRADTRAQNVSGVSITVRTSGGLPVNAVTLADDGLHNDGAAGDHIFGGSMVLGETQEGLNAEAGVTYSGFGTVSWKHVVENISTAKVFVSLFSVASDNINNDGVPNPGENVRYIVTLRNASSSLDFAGLTVSTVIGGQKISIPALSHNSAFPLVYDQNDPATYFSFDVPKGYADSTLTIVLVTTDLQFNQWADTLVFPVRPLKYALHGTLLTHALGTASGLYSILVVDSTKVKNHLYVIRGADTAGLPGGYTLKDSTTGVVLLRNHAVPDSLGHTSPIIDGFKILLGSIDLKPGMKAWSVPSGERRLSPVGGALFGLEGFSISTDPNAAQDRSAGTIGMAANLSFGGIGTTLQGGGDYHDVLLKWAAVPADTSALWDPNVVPADTNYSLSYRYLRTATAGPGKPSFIPWIKVSESGYPYQDYVYGVPFSAWDMSYNPPRRLAVGHLENNQPGGLVDGRYWPALPSVDNGDAAGPREFCFIYSSPYTATAVAPFSTNLSNNVTMPIMWVLTCSRKTDPPFSNADQFEIMANHFPSPQDVWTFTPSVLTTAPRQGVPASFALSQNFPNPFNPSTTIRYQIPATGKVTISIYNILGQEVRSLVNDVQNAGSHTAVWDSRNDGGSVVASGVYFYRCSVAASARGSSFSQTMKMLLVK